MHCVEIATKNLKAFKDTLAKQGVEVTVVSRYVDRGVRLADVEVSRDTKAVTSVERQFQFIG